MTISSVKTNMNKLNRDISIPPIIKSLMKQLIAKVH